MNESTRIVIQSTFEASNKGSIHFGEVIAKLASVQVESYYVDYRTGRTTYYLPDGATLDLDFERPQEGIAEAFDGDALRSAILGAQQGRVMYPEFKHLSQRAGCSGYTVWIAGRHVAYAGRKGETHIERFPN
ncbi:DUF1398 family protein [Variovorax sp. YR216]|uniref:DUF1398 family protein n=1 Tax=Variovorax sp. YR216 TaxID=1882828 RepID=UPI000897BE33|nr:DUF1398 family protein [Variovorax sp. YR216]SEB14297.1 Uncharacterized conserved protein YbcV, DUF1398 family [Variovorax sp. YR216]